MIGGEQETRSIAVKNVHFLEEGSLIHTLFGKDIIINKCLGEGADRWAYLVNYDGEKRILIWLKKTIILKQMTDYYHKVLTDINIGAPNSSFNWPIDITEIINGEFGYVVNFIPPDYHELGDYLRCEVKFKSYKALANAALAIVMGFKSLHMSGLAYYDANEGCVLIVPEDGRVLFTYNDCICAANTTTNRMIKPRYAAPELLQQGNVFPNVCSDRFMMAVILYNMFFLGHPLEGKRYLATALPSSLQENLYVSEALFTMDPYDHSNGPHPVLHKNSIALWSCVPNYVRGIFLKAFGQTAIQKPNMRPNEWDWIKVLSRFRSAILTCSCGNEIFSNNGESCKCDACGRDIVVPFKIVFPQYSIPAKKGTRIYKQQLGVEVWDYVSSCGAVVLEKKDSGILGIKNLSDSKWIVITAKGKKRSISTEEIIPLKDGLIFNCECSNVSVKIQVNTQHNQNDQE